MIENARQRQVTVDWIDHFKDARRQYNTRLEKPSVDLDEAMKVDPIIAAAYLAGLESQIGTLERELAEYDAL